MKRIISLVLGFASFLLAAPANPNSTHITGDVSVHDSGMNKIDRLTQILQYHKADGSGLGQLFTFAQEHYFAYVFAIIVIAVPIVFLLHYMAIGPKVFSHGGQQIFAFSFFERLMHFVAGVAFVILIPTGLIMIFGDKLGGGSFVKLARTLHFLATWPFIVAVIPMILIWTKKMLPTMDDVKWLMIVGGYLSKEKKPIPAGKFNAGQKMWFYSCTFGGIVMIATGLIMYYRTDFTLFDLSAIDTLRTNALVHNILGMAVVALFFTHIYMAVFAIKGAIHSIISGYKPEEEVKILHSTWYKELKKEGKIK